MTRYELSLQLTSPEAPITGSLFGSAERFLRFWSPEPPSEVCHVNISVQDDIMLDVTTVVLLDSHESPDALAQRLQRELLDYLRAYGHVLSEDPLGTITTL